jgi:AAA15 family ATPase/GTPase
MELKRIKCSRFKGEENEWSIEGRPQKGEFGQWLEVNNINLIAGKNASGKSRTLDVIRHVAALLSDSTRLSRLESLGYGTAEYELVFAEPETEIQYFLTFKDGEILQEKIIENQQEKLNRAEGKLWYEEVKSHLEFEVDSTILAISKRDKKQHSFFEKLYDWGNEVDLYRFGSPLGKHTFLRKADIQPDLKDKHRHLNDDAQVTNIFIKAKDEFGKLFVNDVIDDMRHISYDISSVDMEEIPYLPMIGYGLVAYELGLDHSVDQGEMSQGMFRVLSLIIQLNYVLLKRIPSCILIDDIGEGLDFERSQQLIELILYKFKNSPTQVIMTTNDRFVMNKVPLEYWQAIERIPKKSLFYNYQNSREIFEEYKYSGLSNFDFLATGFYTTGLQTEE